MVSDDGSRWVSVNSGVATCSDITFGNGKYVVVGWNGAILTSSDGLIWSSRLSGTTQHLVAVAFDGVTFVAGGPIGTVLTSSNGVVWTERDTRAVLAGENINDLQFINGQLLASGRFGGIFASSDGKSWTRRRSSSSLSPDLSVFGIAFGNARYVAVGEKGQM